MSFCKVHEEPLTLSNLPSDVLIHIFSFLKPEDIANVSQTCMQLYDFVENTDYIWRQTCLRHCHLPYVEMDIESGFSWKESCLRSYGSTLIRRNWFQGVYSSPKSLDDLPDDIMCKMDAETWGEIFELELMR